MNHLSRRERQIMDALFSMSNATVRQIREQLPDPPTDMAVRRMLQILEEKGIVKRNSNGREVVYEPVQEKGRAGLSALQHVLDTFFGGTIEHALAAHLGKKESFSEAERDRLLALINQAKQAGN